MQPLGQDGPGRADAPRPQRTRVDAGSRRSLFQEGAALRQMATAAALLGAAPCERPYTGLWAAMLVDVMPHEEEPCARDAAGFDNRREAPSGDAKWCGTTTSPPHAGHD